MNTTTLFTRGKHVHVTLLNDEPFSGKILGSDTIGMTIVGSHRVRFFPYHAISSIELVAEVTE